MAGAGPFGATPLRPGRPPPETEAGNQVRFGTKWLDMDVRLLRDDEGNEHPKIEPDPTHPRVIRTVRGGGYLFSPAEKA